MVFYGFLLFCSVKRRIGGSKTMGKCSRRRRRKATITLLPSFFQRLEEEGNTQGVFSTGQPVASVFEEWQAALQEFLPATLTRLLNKYESRRRLRFPRGTWPGEAPRMETSLVQIGF